MFSKGMRVVKIINVMGTETASVTKIAKAGDGWVQCKGDDSLKYGPRGGREIDPAIPGCSSRLVAMDGQ